MSCSPYHAEAIIEHAPAAIEFSQRGQEQRAQKALSQLYRRVQDCVLVCDGNGKASIGERRL